MAIIRQANKDKLTCLRRFKCKKALTDEEGFAERLIHSHFYDTAATERSSSNGVDGLLNAPDDTRLEVSLHQAAKAQAAAHLKGSGGGTGGRDGEGGGGGGGGSGGNRLKERAEQERVDKNNDKDKGAGKSKSHAGDRARKTPTPRRSKNNGVPRCAVSCTPSSDYMRAAEPPELARRRRERARSIVDPGGRPDSLQAQPPPPRFHNGTSMQDAILAQLAFLEGELARFVAPGAWRYGTNNKWVSRLFLVPKPGVNQWPCIIDLRMLTSYCVRKRIKMETLLGVRHLTKKGE
eukprot:jgi/Tetstr1/429328/TSEL_019246.t1